MEALLNEHNLTLCCGLPTGGRQRRSQPQNLPREAVAPAGTQATLVQDGVTVCRPGCRRSEGHMLRGALEQSLEGCVGLGWQ